MSSRRLTSSGAFPSEGFDLPHRIAKTAGQKAAARWELEKVFRARIVRKSRCRAEDYDFGRGLNVLWEYNETSPRFQILSCSGSVTGLTIQILEEQVLHEFEIPSESNEYFDIRLNETAYTLELRVKSDPQSQSGDCWVFTLWDKLEPMEALHETRRMFSWFKDVTARMSTDWFAHRSYYIPVTTNAVDAGHQYLDEPNRLTVNFKGGVRFQFTGELATDAFKQAYFGPRWQRPDAGAHNVMSVNGEDTGVETVIRFGEDANDAYYIARGRTASRKHGKKQRRLVRVRQRSEEVASQRSSQSQNAEVPQDDELLERLSPIREDSVVNDLTEDLTEAPAMDPEVPDQDWPVERLLEKRGTGRDAEYLVQWSATGGDVWDPTWEPAGNINQSLKNRYASERRQRSEQ